MKTNKTGHFMKAAIAFILCAILIESGISVSAKDTPNQAAARAALEQKLYQLNHSMALSLPNTNTAAAPSNAAGSTTNKAVKARTHAAIPEPQSASVSAPPSDTAFTSNVPAGNASAQAAALAALEKKMSELSHPKVQPPSDTNSTVTMTTVPSAVPHHEVSANATPVTEMPARETPAAKVPTAASATIAPTSAAPAAVTSSPKVSTAAAAAAAPARTQQVLSFPFSSPGLVRPTNKLVTTTGAIYKNVEVEKVLVDGIVISYVPAHGGWARTKVPFRDLPPEIRRQYENRQERLEP